jgi:hypothetical protein
MTGDLLMDSVGATLTIDGDSGAPQIAMRRTTQTGGPLVMARWEHNAGFALGNIGDTYPGYQIRAEGYLTAVSGVEASATKAQRWWNTGDIEFYKTDGTTTSLLWDESDDQWEFLADIDMGTNEIIGVQVIRGAASPASITFADADGTSRFNIIGDGDWALRNSIGNSVWEWDDSEDVLIASENVFIGDFLAPTLLLDRTLDTGNASLAFYTTNVLKGALGLQGSGNENFYLTAYDGDLFLKARSASAAPADVYLQADDAGGIIRTRLRVVGNSSTFIYDDAGVQRLSVDSGGIAVVGKISGTIVDPTLGTHVGDRDYSDARYLELAGSTATGVIDRSGTQALTTKQFRNVYVGTSAPGSPDTGDLWLDTT